MEYRNSEYWQNLMEHSSKIVRFLSKKLENRINWSNDFPFIKFLFSNEDIDESPYICRNGDGCEIGFNRGFLKWLDEAVLDIEQDDYLRNTFELKKANNSFDVSFWILNQWISWFLYHEIGHFACGHLVNETRIWEEWMPGHDTWKLSMKTRLAYEYDADIFAAQTFFSSLAEVINYPEVYSKGIQFNMDGLIKDFGFIFFAFFIYLNRKNAGNDHPIAQDRMWIFLHFGFAVLKAELDRNVENEIRLFKNGVMECLNMIGDEANMFSKFSWDKVAERVISNREELLKNKIEIRRVLPIQYDWLKYDFL